MSTPIRNEPPKPGLAKPTPAAAALQKANSVTAAQAAKVADALFSAAFASMGKTTDGAPVQAAEVAAPAASLPVFEGLFTSFVAGKPPQGPIAKDFGREAPPADFDAGSVLAQNHDFPS